MLNVIGWNSLRHVGRQPLVLGTASPFRHTVLKNAGIRFHVRTADIDEKAIRHPSPAVMVEMIARAKAEAIASTLDVPSFLVTCDEVVVFQGEVREKPADEAQARKWIKGYRGQSLACVTAVYVLDTGTGRSRSGTCIAEVRFLDFGFTPDEIELTVQRGTALTVCGAYVRHDPTYVRAMHSIEAMDHQSRYMSSRDAEHVIQGLPLRITMQFLKELG